MLRGPAKHLVIMIWWILLSFFLHVFSYPLQGYLSSYLVYFIPFGFVLGVAVLLNLCEWRLRLWSNSKHWGRLLILGTAYTVAIGASLVVTISLNSRGAVAYFGGDAEGSIGLFYLPSIVFYWIAGAAACGYVSVVQTTKKRDCATG